MNPASWPPQTSRLDLPSGWRKHHLSTSQYLYLEGNLELMPTAVFLLFNILPQCQNIKEPRSPISSLLYISICHYVGFPSFILLQYMNPWDRTPSLVLNSTTTVDKERVHLTRAAKTRPDLPPGFREHKVTSCTLKERNAQRKPQNRIPGKIMYLSNQKNNSEKLPSNFQKLKKKKRGEGLWKSTHSIIHPFIHSSIQFN